MKVPLQITVNGRSYALEVEAHHTLLQTLRDNLELSGTKECCSQGECGACTVLVNGRPVDSCLMLAVEAEGEEITTIEGLARGHQLDSLQKAFLDKGAVQCGFCIPGMILSAKALLLSQPRPTAAEIQAALAGNLCRCAGYSKIIEAVKVAAEAGAL